MFLGLCVQDESGIPESSELGKILWPASSALTARLRRLITTYQRYNRREPLRHDFLMLDGASHVPWQMGEDIRRCAVEPDPLFLEWQRRFVMQIQL